MTGRKFPEKSGLFGHRVEFRDETNRLSPIPQVSETCVPFARWRCTLCYHKLFVWAGLHFVLLRSFLDELCLPGKYTNFFETITRQIERKSLVHFQAHRCRSHRVYFLPSYGSKTREAAPAGGPRRVLPTGHRLVSCPSRAAVHAVRVPAALGR